MWRRSASLIWILRKPVFLGPPEVQQERYDYRCQQDELNDPAKLTNGHVHGVCQRRCGEPVRQSEANQIREEGSKGRLFDVPRQAPLASRRLIVLQTEIHASSQHVHIGTAAPVIPVHESYRSALFIFRDGRDTAKTRSTPAPTHGQSGSSVSIRRHRWSRPSRRRAARRCAGAREGAAACDRMGPGVSDASTSESTRTPISHELHASIRTKAGQTASTHGLNLIAAYARPHQ